MEAKYNYAYTKRLLDENKDGGGGGGDQNKDQNQDQNKDQNQNPENGISLSGLFLFCLHAVASTVVFISAYVCIFRIITVLSHIP